MNRTCRNPARIRFRQPFLSFALLIALLGLTGLRAGAATPEARDLTRDFVVPDGLKVTLWAESPKLYNPTSIDIDQHGRVWVAEAVNYRTFHKTGPDQPPGGTLPRPEGDRIVILEDTDGDGICDQSKVFAQDKDLHAPLGIAVMGSEVLVSCSPHVIRYRDTDGDDRPEEKEIFLTGFGGRDHDHGVHSLVAGPDGRWLFNTGNAGPHIVTDRNGWTLRAGSVYTGGTPHNTENVPGLVSDDGRVWTGGVALRIKPDGTDLTVMAHNFRNSYEMAIDSFGSMWQSDNDDQVRSCRTSWVMEGGNMGYFSAEGSRMWQADRRPGQSTQSAHWHQADPGVVPAGDIYGAGAPAGITVYEGKLLPETIQGAVLNADAGRNTIFAHKPVPKGAGFEFKRSILLSSRRESTKDYVWHEVSEKKKTYFRPSDVAVGPSGALYVADWYDPIVGGHAMHDTQGYGRILRIAPKSADLKPPKLDLDTINGALTALKSPAINVRYLGYRHLLETPTQTAFPAVRSLARKSPLRERARAIWLMARMGKPGRQFLDRAIHFDSPRLRVTAFRAIRQSGQEILPTARELARDPSPAVRREVAIALRDFPYRDSRELLLKLAMQYDGKDRYYLEAWGLGCDGKENAIYPDLLQRLDSPSPLQWSDKLSDLVWRLHPLAAVQALRRRAASSKLETAAREQAVDSLAFVRHRTAAKALKAVAASTKGPVSTKAEWWLNFRSENDWDGYKAVTQKGADDEGPGYGASQKPMLKLRDRLLAAEANPAERVKIARKLAQSPEGGLMLIELAKAGKLDSKVREVISERIFKNPSLSVRALATQVFSKDTAGDSTFPSIPKLMNMKGDPEAGRKVFFSAKAACSQCHRVEGQGKRIGPDLTHIDSKLTRRALFDAILNPNAELAFGYQPWLITLENGATYSGFLLGDGNTVILRDAAGRRHSIPSDSIATRQKLGYSLMPDNIALGLTPQELVDLTAFLLR